MTRRVQYNDIDPNVYDLDEDAVQEDKENVPEENEDLKGSVVESSEV